MNNAENLDGFVNGLNYERMVRHGKNCRKITIENNLGEIRAHLVAQLMANIEQGPNSARSHDDAVYLVNKVNYVDEQLAKREPVSEFYMSP